MSFFFSPIKSFHVWEVILDISVFINIGFMGENIGLCPYFPVKTDPELP